MSLGGVTTRFVSGLRPYTGVELRPHYLLSQLELRGSGLAAFVGPCTVKTEHLVDWEDRLASDHIEARSMVHFLGEFFGSGLREGVLRQRLLMSTLGDVLNQALRDADRPEISHREGDDLFVAGRKLSVSIVTASPVSVLLHAGINIDPAGAPVPAIGLAELGVAPETFARSVLDRFAEEWQGIDWACAKVRPVV